MRLGWQVKVDDIVYTTSAKRFGSMGYRIILKPVLKMAGPSYIPIPRGTDAIEVGIVLKDHRGGWTMCGYNLGLPDEFHAIQGFRTAYHAAFQLLKERGFEERDANC